MGNWNSGRRPAPTSLKVLRGKVPARVEAPTPAPAGPAFDVPPAVLESDPVAAAYWREVAPLLRAYRIATDLDRAVLTALCQKWSQYVAAQADVARRPLVRRKGKGLVVNPALAVADKALAAVRWLMLDLGLTPGARARLVRVPAPAPDATAAKWAGLV